MSGDAFDDGKEQFTGLPPRNVTARDTTPAFQKEACDFNRITIPPRAVPTFQQAMAHGQPVCPECGRPIKLCAACESGKVEGGS